MPTDTDLDAFELRPSYFLHWVTRGSAHVSSAGRAHRLAQGEGHVSHCGSVTSVARRDADTRIAVVCLTLARVRRVHRALRASARRLLAGDGASAPLLEPGPRRACGSVAIVVAGLAEANALGLHDPRWMNAQYDALAERLLFDACLRGRGGRSMSRGGALEARLHKVKHYMEDQCERPLALCDLADRAAVSPHHFLRTFKTAFSLTPHRYLVTLRLRRARQLLVATDLPVREIGARVGFLSANGFYSAFRNRYRHAPAALRDAGGQGGVRPGTAGSSRGPWSRPAAVASPDSPRALLPSRGSPQTDRG